MKIKSLILLLLVGLLFAGGCSNKPRILIAYYSQSGNTKAVAEQIKTRFGGDLYEIEPAVPYPSGEQETIEIVGRQREESIRPELSGKVENLGDYDVVFLGTPIWFGTASLPMFSFVEAHDFTGKTVIPFYTCGGGDVGTYVKDITPFCEGAAILEAFGNSRSEREAGTHIVKVDSHLNQLNF